MKKDEIEIGRRVKSLRDFSGVPKGTEGIIDEEYGKGIMIAWDLPGKPLPNGYKEFDKNIPLGKRPYILRDGFDKETELDFLECV